MAGIHAGWERLILPWDQVQPSGADDFSHLGITISDSQLQNELDRGIESRIIEEVESFRSADTSWARGAPGDITFIAGTGKCTIGQVVRRGVGRLPFHGRQLLAEQLGRPLDPDQEPVDGPLQPAGQPVPEDQPGHRPEPADHGEPPGHPP